MLQENLRREGHNVRVYRSKPEAKNNPYIKQSLEHVIVYRDLHRNHRRENHDAGKIIAKTESKRHTGEHPSYYSDSQPLLQLNLFGIEVK